MGLITQTTNATPIVVTTSGAHGLSTGNAVIIAGVLTAPEANGTWIITVVDGTNFSLNGSVGAHASMGGTATWTLTTNPTGVITNATNATPIVVTSASHGLTSGISVSITGIVGNTAANGTWVITVVNANTFLLLGSAGNAGYTSGGAFVVVSGSQITGATNANPIVITSVAHGLSTGDIVAISGVIGNTAANSIPQIPANPITKLTADTFSIPVTGNGAYVSGGRFVVQHPIDPAASPFGTTTTLSSGLSDLVLSDAKQSVIADGAQVYYGVKQAGVLIEAGIGFYNATANSIMRTDVGYGNSDGSFISLNSGGATINYQVAGTLTGPASGMVASGIAPAGPTGIFGPPKADDAQLALAMAFGIAQQKVATSTGILGTMTQNTPLPMNVKVSIMPAYQPVPSPNFPPIFTFPGTYGAGNPALIGGMSTASIVQTNSLMLSTSSGIPVNQGVININPSVFQNDSNRLGSGNRIYFVPTGLPGINVADEKVTLYCIDNVSSGYRDIRILQKNGNVLNPPSSLQLDAPSPIPFQYTSGKMNTQATVKWGVPADIFLFFPPYGNPGTAQPQMFYLNWWSATARTNGQTGGSQLGYQLTTKNGVVNLRVVNEAWFADGTVKASDLLYLYVGTIVPTFDGIASNYPNLRLVLNQFNRSQYTDLLDDDTPYWLVNDALHSDSGTNLHERMNPSIGVCAGWRHYFVDPTDYQFGVDLVRNLPSMWPELAFIAGAWSAGKVQIDLADNFNQLWDNDQNNTDGERKYLTFSALKTANNISPFSAGISYMEIQASFTAAGRSTANQGKKWGFWGKDVPMNIDLTGQIVKGGGIIGFNSDGTPISGGNCGLSTVGLQ